MGAEDGALPLRVAGAVQVQTAKNWLAVETCWAELPVALLLTCNCLITLLVMLAYHVLPALCTVPVSCILYVLVRLDPHLETQVS